MANSSDSNYTTNTNTSSDIDSDDYPRTPPLAALPEPRVSTNTTRPLITAPLSKIPKLRTTSVSVSQPQAPVSPPRTPANRDTTPAGALDWGSGGEWSALVGESKRSASTSASEVEAEDEAVVGGGDDGVHDVEPVEISENVEDVPLGSAVASSGLFDDGEYATVNLERSFDEVEPKEVSDDDYQPLIVFEDGDQQDGEGEEEGGHGGVGLEGESSDGAGTLSSDSELSGIHGISALEERYGAAEDSDGFSDDEVLPVVFVLEESELQIIGQHGPHENGQDGSHGAAEQETEPSVADASQTSGSVSDIHTTPASKQPGDTDRFEKVNDDEKLPAASVLQEHEQRIVGQDDPHHTAEQETELSDADASQNSGSDSDMHDTSGPKQSSDTDLSKKVSDVEKLPIMSTSSDSRQHIFEQKGLHENAMQESDLSGSDAFQSSGSDFDVNTAPARKQPGDAVYLEKVGDDEQHAIVRSPKAVSQIISEQKTLHETTIQETELSDADVSHASDSDVSDMQLPAVTIRGPFLNMAGRGRRAGRPPAVSPEMVLRGLIRDAHPEMIHFTLPHSLFSPDDLQKGHQYAYSMLQVATSKLALMELLNDETTNMTGTDLRRWVALVDNPNPRTCPEPRISVIFESLSIGEMKAALEELVQSRLVVEGEAEKTQMLLLVKVAAKEQQEKSWVIPAKRAATFDKECGSSTKKRRVFEEDNETALDAFLTAIMVLLVVVLYLCVREWPIGSVGDRWMNMKT